MVESKLAERDRELVEHQGQRIVELRHRMGLTQAELCRDICTQAALSNYEHGVRQLPILVAMRLAARLQISLCELVGETR